MEFNIRHANVEDALALINYNNIVGGESDNLSFGKDEFDYTLQQEIDYLKSMNNNNVYMVAEYQNKIIGSINISSSNRMRIKHNGYLGISVLAEYQRRGVGLELLTTLIEYLRKHSDITNIFLEVRSDNYKAINLYKKAGFIKSGVSLNAYYINDTYYDIDQMYLSLNENIKQ